MATDFSKTLSPEIYTINFRVLMPALLIGAMLMAVAFASKSAADSEQRSIEQALASRNAMPEDLREEIFLHAGVTESSPLNENVIAATTSGLTKLTSAEQVAALERVSIDITLPNSVGPDQSADELPLELLEVLSRRAYSLQLQLTLRVAPANAEAAMQWFDAIRDNVEPDRILEASEIAISLDESVPNNELRLDILRTKKMVTLQESQQ